MLDSNYRQLCNVILPVYAGRQKYMHTFDLSCPTMPDGLEDYCGAIVSLCRAARAYVGHAHVTVDEKLVQAGMSQRRPKPHVDGCFIPRMNKWGGGGGGGGGGWKHYCDDVGSSAVGRMAVIVVSSQVGCRVWRGSFDGRPAKDGDLSHISDKLGEGEILKPNVGYLLSPDCVHESMIMDKPTPRTFLRIALPSAFKY